MNQRTLKNAWWLFRGFFILKLEIMSELIGFQGNDNNDKKTMSSLEIAELTNKRHYDVVLDIERIFEEVGIDKTEFSVLQKSTNNKRITVYYLPKRECNLIVAGYSAKYRLAIIDRWELLENQKQFQIPKTYSEALKLASEQAEQIEKQKLLIQEQAPKVVAFENVIDNANTYTLDSVSDILDIGRTTLCKLLEQKNWKTKRETHGTSSTRYAEENGYAKTIYEYIRIKDRDIKTKRFVLKKKGLEKLISEFNK